MDLVLGPWWTSGGGDYGGIKSEDCVPQRSARRRHRADAAPPIHLFSFLFGERKPRGAFGVARDGEGGIPPR